MSFRIEFVGGPADGEIRTIASEMRMLKFLAPLNLSPVERFETGMGPPEHIEMIEVVYVRTNRISHAGNRIYQYRK